MHNTRSQKANFIGALLFVSVAYADVSEFPTSLKKNLSSRNHFSCMCANFAENYTWPGGWRALGKSKFSTLNLRNPGRFLEKDPSPSEAWSTLAEIQKSKTI